MSHDYDSYKNVGSKISIKTKRNPFHILIYDSEAKI